MVSEGAMQTVNGEKQSIVLSIRNANESQQCPTWQDIPKAAMVALILGVTNSHLVGLTVQSIGGHS